MNTYCFQARKIPGLTVKMLSIYFVLLISMYQEYNSEFSTVMLRVINKVTFPHPLQQVCYLYYGYNDSSSIECNGVLVMLKTLWSSGTKLQSHMRGCGFKPHLVVVNTY
uniref:Uncharacterized protein n=1 Tax=Ipomoea trifida TaxID=35884 RepID=A0A8Z8_IPOTF|nr:hypothetical protein [Ipomoea trifida]